MFTNVYGHMTGLRLVTENEHFDHKHIPANQKDILASLSKLAVDEDDDDQPVLFVFLGSFRWQVLKATVEIQI